MLVRSAFARNLSLSEDAENRIQQSFHWDQAFGDVKKMRAEARAAMERGVEGT